LLPLLCFHLFWLQGYNAYITLLYVLNALILLSIAATVWVALALRKDESRSVWMRRCACCFAQACDSADGEQLQSELQLMLT
jgi:hypothetical protein